MPSTPSRARVSRSSAARTARMFAFGWWPIRSNRKPSTLYCLAQVTTRVDHQLAHHGVLGRGVGAAGRVGDGAVVEQPVVVAGHDLVEHRLRVGAGGGRVVVDHVQHHPQAGAVEPGDHLPELGAARGAVRVDGVAALRDGVVQRVVAPVVAVGVGDRRDARLLPVGVRRQRRQVAGGLALVGPPLGDGREVEHRQQVQVGRARRRPSARQVLHPGRGGSVKAR